MSKKETWNDEYIAVDLDDDAEYVKVEALLKRPLDRVYRIWDNKGNCWYPNGGVLLWCSQDIALAEIKRYHAVQSVWPTYETFGVYDHNTIIKELIENTHLEIREFILVPTELECDEGEDEQEDEEEYEDVDEDESGVFFGG